MHLARTTGRRRQRGAVSGSQVGADGMAVGGKVRRRLAALSLVIVFSVTLPAEAEREPEVRPAAWAVGRVVTAHSRDGDVMVTELSISPDVDYDGEAGMRGSVDGSAKATGGTVSDYRLVPFGRYQGAVATIEGGRGVAKMMRLRLVYTGKAVIVVGCTGSLYDRTVTSLHIS